MTTLPQGSGLKLIEVSLKENSPICLAGTVPTSSFLITKPEPERTNHAPDLRKALLTMRVSASGSTLSPMSQRVPPRPLPADYGTPFCLRASGARLGHLK